jgi:hypothetical protein
MTGVVSALKADNTLSAFAQPIDDLAFAFIAPLRTDNDYIFPHDESSLSPEAFKSKLLHRKSAPWLGAVMMQQSDDTTIGSGFVIEP